jgi:hypothetical protein
MMTDEDLQQMRAIVHEAVAPLDAKIDRLDARQAATDTKIDRLTSKVDGMDTKLDRVIARADDILTGIVRLRTDAENRDAGIRQEIENLRERVEALEGRR